MTAPSGIFCKAIPSDRAKALAIVIVSLPDNIPASTTPTAIPSGKLCKVTAKTSIVDFFKVDGFPSGSSLSKCK